MSHTRAAALMVVVTLMWSIAGVVTRHLEAARAFEVTFWRSAFNAAFLTLALSLWRGRALWQALAQGGWPLWVSGVMWSIMYTCFMVALTLTTVANVLVTMALAPLVTALVARLALGQRLPSRTWVAIALAGTGIAWMYGSEVSGADARHLAGTLVALGVPLAAAVNWTVIQRSGQPRTGAAAQDMLPAVLIGALLSSLVSLPLAWPLQASGHDLGWLAVLGVFQLAIPCLLAVRLARVLPAAEVALLGLLEVVFGVAWAWLGAGEAPNVHVLCGGALVLLALAGNEALGLRRVRQGR
ncbi:DMT family transporter [Caldimonas thermodepolymerans]|uniref:Permease n=2 Tax=Caldimonas thermodepolymerans TaxID=215580 RepID=A0A2S5T7B6_9BURK|nr:DMT family transporter [Caldimonas thermodepolymerans]PPE70895.1 permease [Caldimonas thermodepolymerans]QPC33119.1 DMT family transporter [Caldimonas thermodepolymerans]UZG45992.1 DMT family transporter [Caldimonas thermodepolymerans]UZG46272.1 DMT family transporter [Caldimonas thermodepolymerans]